jgi:hypothetical protein
MAEGLSISDIKILNPNLFFYLANINRKGYILKIINIYILIMTQDGIGITILRIPKKYKKRCNNKWKRKL